MMNNDRIEFAAKDIFVLLDVPTPNNLDVDNKWRIRNDSQNDENFSQFSSDSGKNVLFDTLNDPLVIDITPPEELDNSSSDSITKSELEEKRWYNPKLNDELAKSDFNSLKEILNAIRNTDSKKTLSALQKLREEKILKKSYQNMFIAQNGFEVLVNILDCNNKICLIEALNIIHIMSPFYAVQSQLCDLNAVKPLLGILLFENNPELQNITMDTLYNISHLRKGRKLIRLTSGIQLLVKLVDQSESIISDSKINPNLTHKITITPMLISCVNTLNLLCRSLKSQSELWVSGFVDQLPLLMTVEHIKIQVPIMSLIAKCCRLRPNAVNYKMVKYFRTALQEFNILPHIIQLILNDSSELATGAAEITLGMFDDDNYIYDVLLKHKGLFVVFKAVEKFQSKYTDEHVMVLIITVLWKCSLNESCRTVMEKHDIVDVLLKLLTYTFNDRVIGYAISTLSELWKCESLQPQLQQKALPKFLELLDSSLHSLVLAHVCDALARMSKHPICMEIINGANGFQKVFTLLPSLKIDEFDKYNDIYEPQTIIATTECLTVMIKNSPSEQNSLRGMYDALNDLVDLLTHKNPDILAAVCRLIEAVAFHDDNLKIMIDIGIVENLTNLVDTTHMNLRANLCRAIGKCCVGDAIGCQPSSKNLVEKMWAYMDSGHQIVKDSIPMALRGLSEDPLNCIKIETIGFLPFLIKSIESDNEKTAEAAMYCLRNIRQACTVIGHYSERKAMKKAKNVSLFNEKIQKQ